MTTPVLARTIPEAIEMAAEHLERYGWQPFNFGEAGEPCCAVGALRVVTCGTTRVLSLLGTTDTRVLRDAEQEIQIYLGGPVTAWNDEPGQTAGSVIRTLRRCAAHLRERR